MSPNTFSNRLRPQTTTEQLEALARQRTGLAVRRTDPVHCKACGRTIIGRSARHQRFCSTKCRKQDWGEKRCRKAGLARSTGGATHLPKLSKQTNEVRAAKSGPNPPVSGPARIVETEVFGGRRWDRAVSDDGVPTLVHRRRAGAP